jgi:hypothetical protein
MPDGKILMDHKLENLQKIARQMFESDDSPTPVDACEEEKELLAFKCGMEDFARSGEPSALIREMVDRFCKEALRIEARGNALVLAESKHYVLTLSSIEKYAHRKRSIVDDDTGNLVTSQPSSSLLVNLGNEDIHLLLHAAIGGKEFQAILAISLRKVRGLSGSLLERRSIWTLGKTLPICRNLMFR